MTAKMLRLIERAVGVVLMLCMLAAPLAAHSASATYEYDTKGRVSRITYDDGTVVDYAYDANCNRTGATKTTPPPDTTPPSAPGAPTFSNVTLDLSEGVLDSGDGRSRRGWV